MNKVSYMGNGEITEFDFRFPFYENNNVVVLKNNKPATGYTIVKTPAGDGADVPYLGGRVVFQNAPLPTDSIVISRKLPLSRVVDYQPLAKIEPKLLNLDMNYLMESLKDFQDELDTFNECYNGIVNVESVEVLLKKANFIEQLIQNKMLVTLDDFNSGITNCITEIPQDIKLELNNGTLTLKAGSKVYVPNGFESDGTTPKFDKINIASDTNITGTGGTAQCFICINATGRLSATSAIAASVSGAGVEHINYGLCYDTSTNIIQRWGDGVVAIDKASFPLAIVTVSNGVFTSIDQVFNGFGYIGGTIFALPGIKGLVPNGRNADGTLNSINVFNATTVKINTPSDGERDICLSRYSGYTDVPYVGTYIYDAEDNFVKRSSDGIVGGYVFAGKFTKTGGQITDFYVRPAFHALDYSDFENTVAELNGSILSTKTELNNSISSVDSSAVHKTGNETIAGIKTFESSPKAPSPATQSNGTDIATTAWVRSNTNNVVRLVARQDPTSSNNYEWYRKYSDGWVEQGGWIEGGENIASNVRFPVAMTNTYYSLSFGGTQSTNATSGESSSYRGIFRDTGIVSARSTTGFTLGNGAKISWYVCGYAAQ